MADEQPPMTGVMSDEAWLAYEAARLGADQQGWQVTSMRRANWCLRTIARAKRNQRETARDYADLMAPYVAWREARDKADAATIEHMTQLLRPWFDAQKAAGALPYQRKSLTLPAGVVGERWHGVEFKPNDAELLPWAQAHGLTKSTEAPQWNEIKKQLSLSDDGLRAVIRREVIDERTGEIVHVAEEVPGVQVTSVGGDVFYVEVKTQKDGEVNHAEF